MPSLGRSLGGDGKFYCTSNMLRPNHLGLGWIDNMGFFFVHPVNF